MGWSRIRRLLGAHGFDPTGQGDSRRGARYAHRLVFTKKGGQAGVDLILVRRLFGKSFGDRGAIAHALTEQLFTTPGIALITKVRQNMRERVLAYTGKLLLCKRAIIESVNDQLKNICQIEHTRHRSPYNFLAHLLAGLIAYWHQPKKPSLHFDPTLDLVAAG